MAASAYCKQHETAKISSLSLGEGHIKQVASCWRKTTYPHFTFLAGSEQNESDLHVASVIRAPTQMLHFCISDAARIHLHYRFKAPADKKKNRPFYLCNAARHLISNTRSKKDMTNIIQKYLSLLTVQHTFHTNKATGVPSDIKLTTWLRCLYRKVVTTK